MKNALRAFIAGSDALASALGFAGQIALAAMMVTVCYDAVMRYVFAAPTLWSMEINTFLLIFITLIPAGDILKSNMHLRITFVTARFPERVRTVLDRMASVLGLLFCIFMTWKGWVMSMHALEFNERMSTSLGTPMVIPYLFIPVGFGVLGLQYLVRLLRPMAKPEGTASVVL